MNQNFIVTKINRVILVGKHEYEEEITVFQPTLYTQELIFTFSGKSTISFDGKILHNEAGTVRYLPKGTFLDYTVHRKEHGECIDIFFDTDIPLAEEAFAMKLQSSASVGNLFKKIFSVWVSKDEGHYFECISLLYKILSEIQKQNYLPGNQYHLIKPALDYINENFLNDKISVEYLADLCQISESYLKKLFLKKFGLPPVRYMIQMKINYACDLLRSGLYTVSQTAQLCGYGNVYFFSRQFKEYLGVSPTVFIQKYKSSK